MLDQDDIYTPFPCISLSDDVLWSCLSWKRGEGDSHTGRALTPTKPIWVGACSRTCHVVEILDIHVRSCFSLYSSSRYPLKQKIHHCISFLIYMYWTMNYAKKFCFYLGPNCWLCGKELVKHWKWCTALYNLQKQGFNTANTVGEALYREQHFMVFLCLI